MKKQSQKDAVYNAVSAFMVERDGSFEDGCKIQLSSNDRKTIVSIIVEAIKAHKVEFSADTFIKYDTPEKIRNYTTGLLSNWLRKDTRLNGGEKHKIKNPGFKSDKEDEVIKKLKQMKKIVTNGVDIAKINKEIQLRLEQLQKQRNSAVDDVNIPHHLKHLIKK